MRALLDTNVLTRTTQRDHSQHVLARDSVRQLLRLGYECCIVPQNLYEFWAVANRPIADNGLGLTVIQAQSELARFKRWFTLLRDERGVLPEWEHLAAIYEVKGKTAHDARLVAAMHWHGLTHLLTFNASHFNRFPGITVMTPEEVLQASS